MSILTIIIIVGVLTTVAAISKSITDCLFHNYEQSIFNGCVVIWNEWNPFKSWVNKWEVDEFGRPIRTNGKLKERFFLSSSILVMLTDPWHWFDFLRTACIFGIALLLPAWYILLGAYVWFHIVFHLFYHKVFRV